MNNKTKNDEIEIIKDEANNHETMDNTINVETIGDSSSRDMPLVDKFPKHQERLKRKALADDDTASEHLEAKDSRKQRLHYNSPQDEPSEGESLIFVEAKAAGV